MNKDERKVLILKKIRNESKSILKYNKLSIDENSHLNFLLLNRIFSC